MNALRRNDMLCGCVFGEPQDQKLVGARIVGMFRQRCRFPRVIEFSMEGEPPALDIFPRYIAPANGQEPITILVHSEWDEAVPQNHDT